MSISEDLLDEILASGPSKGTLFLILSRLKEEGQYQRVIQECIRALEAAPGDIRIRGLLAEAFFDTGQISRAEAELERVTGQIRDLMPAYRLLFEVYRRQERTREASSALKTYLALRPEDREAAELLAGMSPLETPGAPAPESPPPGERQGMEESPFQEQDGLTEIATPTLAEVYFNQGQIREALATYEKVLGRDPDDQRSRERLEELRAMEIPDSPPIDREALKKRERDRKTIALLEAWLANIRKIPESSAPL